MNVIAVTISFDSFTIKNSIFIDFFNTSVVLSLSGCVGDDNAKGDGTDKGSCSADGELCTALGECLGI